MRLLIAALNRDFAISVRQTLYLSDARWRVTLAQDGAQALSLLQTGEFGLALIHACLPFADGVSVLNALDGWRLCCPPRVMLICEPELCRDKRADCRVPLYTSAGKVCALLNVLAQKPVPRLAAAHMSAYEREADALLNALGMSLRLKGYAYARWLLCRLAPSPMLEALPIEQLYRGCAAAHKTTPAAVERCLRVAVEGVFMQGSMAGIERHFGATVDPERGKPTNRAFLSQAASRVRLAYSLAETRLPNSMDMHQSPAAPTIV